MVMRRMQPPHRDHYRPMADHIRLSGTAPDFVCTACGKRGRRPAGRRPEVLQTIRGQLGIAHGVPDAAMAQDAPFSGLSESLRHYSATSFPFERSRSDVTHEAILKQSRLSTPLLREDIQMTIFKIATMCILTAGTLAAFLSTALDPIGDCRDHLARRASATLSDSSCRL
jgi:hypothetical protein